MVWVSRSRFPTHTGSDGIRRGATLPHETRPPPMTSDMRAHAIHLPHWHRRTAGATVRRVAETAPASPVLSPRIATLLDALRRGSAGALEAFWAEAAGRGLPLIEPIADDRERVLVTLRVVDCRPDGSRSWVRKG